MDFENGIVREKEAESIHHAVESAGGSELETPGRHLSGGRCRLRVYANTAAVSKPW